MKNTEPTDKMMKHKFTLFALAALAFGCTEAVAQSGPPKANYQCDFENVSKPDYNDEEMVINGKKWRFHNARIVGDSLRGIPQGRKALELKAGVTDGEPTCIEMLDNVEGRTVTFAVYHSGMDRIINRNGKAWRFEVTFDNGQTWAHQPLNYDTNDIPTRFVADVPTDGTPYRFRIRFHDTGEEGKDWRILLDDFMVMEGYDYSVPWTVSAGHIFNGFCTAETSLTFKPILTGTSFWFGPEDFDRANTYIELTLDDNAPVKYYEMPIDIVFKLENLSEGKHHVNMRFMNRADKQVWEDARETDFDFYVRPIEQIKGIKALRKAEVGKFYELIPDGDDAIYVNWVKMSRAQKWLFDGKSGIWVDDPQYLDYYRNLPANLVSVKSMRGQLVEMDNNLVFRLDRKPEVETIDTKPFTFRNYMCHDLADLAANFDDYAGLPLSLVNVKFVKPFMEIDANPNGRIEIADSKGNQFILQNIYHDGFQRKDFPTTPSIIVFGMVGRTFIDNKPCFFPLKAVPYEETSGVDDVASNENGVKVWNADGNVYLSSMRKAEVEVYDVSGKTVLRAVVDEGGSQILNVGSGVYVAVAKYGNGMLETIKFVK